LSTSLTVPSPPAATIKSYFFRDRFRREPPRVARGAVAFSAEATPISSRWRRKRRALLPRAAGLKMTQMRTDENLPQESAKDTQKLFLRCVFFALFHLRSR